jgi:hypothetical protein
MIFQKSGFGFHWSPSRLLFKHFESWIRTQNRSWMRIKNVDRSANAQVHYLPKFYNLQKLCIVSKLFSSSVTSEILSSRTVSPIPAQASIWRAQLDCVHSDAWHQPVPLGVTQCHTRLWLSSHLSPHALLYTLHFLSCSTFWPISPQAGDLSTASLWRDMHRQRQSPHTHPRFSLLRGERDLQFFPRDKCSISTRTWTFRWYWWYISNILAFVEIDIGSTTRDLYREWIWLIGHEGSVGLSVCKVHIYSTRWRLFTLTAVALRFCRATAV